MEFLKKSPNLNFMHILLFSILINISLSQGCPRDKPIFKSHECQAIYCTPQEYSSGTCIISNDIIKTQWLNGFHPFGEGHMSHISVSKNKKGELFISSQKPMDDFDKYMCGFNSEGEGLFYDNVTNKNTTFEIIDFPIREFADYNNYVEIDGKGYLLGVPTDDDIYLIDYMNKTIKSYTIRPISKGSDTIFKMNNHNNMFFTAYVYCTGDFNKKCALHFKSFKLNLTKLEPVKNISDISTVFGVRTNCFQNDKAYIFCFYTKQDGTIDVEDEEEDPIPILGHYLSVIEPESFQFIDTILIEKDFRRERMFDETIHLKNDLYVLAYAVEDQVVKVQFKNIIINTNLEQNPIIYEDYFKNIKEIYINNNTQYDIEHGSFKRNSMCKINDNKFAIFLKEYSKDSYKATNSRLLIYIFTLFNNDKNINMRKYLIDFELYNKHTSDDIRGYTLGDFFGMVLGLTPTIDSSIVTATYLTFGYVNTTEQKSIDVKLKYNSTESKIIISDYINEMENNIFGYEFLGVKILSLPYEEEAGYFISSANNKKVEENDIVPRNSELKFILSKNFEEGVYSIQFAGIVKEPDYDTMNTFADEVVSYPDEISEKDFYEPKTMMGKKINYEFRLSRCYDSCKDCSALSIDDNNQKCISCREGFYFKVGTTNCYDKIETKYYLDPELKVFVPCYKDCLTCSYHEISEKEMNCLSCETDLKYYNLSNNCLNCEKYVNYEQNECIDEIPEGYYLEDKDLGTLGKCYFLCKTCSAGPYTKNNHLHMNCDTCLFENKSFRPIFQGDCPESSEDDPDAPVGGKCPLDKPILKNGKCQIIYCTDDEYQKEICKILNPIAKIQWLDNPHYFSEVNNSEISVAQDFVSFDKIFLMSQNTNKANGYKEKYLYGFHNNGAGLFYNKNKDIYDSFKKFDFLDNVKLIDKIGYIEMDYDGYLLTTPIDNYLYILDYEDDKIIKTQIDTPAYSTDKIIVMEIEDESIDPDYISTYIYCKEGTNLKECYLMMKDFEADEEELDERVSTRPVIRVHSNSQLNCYKDISNFLRCTYTKYVDDSNYKHVFSLFSSGSLSFVTDFELEDNYDTDPSFDSMIKLKNNVTVVAYSTKNNKNVIKLLLKTIYRDVKTNTFYLNDYIKNIPEILLNEDYTYKFEGGKASSNSLVKISNDKFALLVNNFKDDSDLNSGIVVFVVNIYDSNQKINVRHYPIYFKLYNTLINKKIIGYNLNEFLGVLMELTTPSNNNLIRATFFTFGYINTTNEISPMEGNDLLIVKKQNIKLSNYFKTIENNLFGYQYSKINIISVPNEAASGYFTLNNQDNKLKPGDNISNTSEISFHISSNPKTGNYSIVFAPIIEEPSTYDEMNSFSQRIQSYPKGYGDTEKNFYTPKTKFGKYFSFNFYIKGELECFDNCETCYQQSKIAYDQQCIQCKTNYYKVYETNNCFPRNQDKYYFDEKTQLLMPCYENCFSCNESGNKTKMNCLSCDPDEFKYYKKSTNCLTCPLYIDYSQTKCINTIPDGYYLEDKELGTIEKCYELCSTCESKAVIENGQIYMNCKTCKYNNNTNKIKIEGNCPEAEEKPKEGGTNLFTWIIILSVIIFVVALLILFIILYKKCLKKKSDIFEDDFRKPKGKNISLQEEYFPINN